MIRQSLLQIRDLAISFTVEAGKVGVVRDLDLDVLPGEIVALVGESGCGKSITARSILGLLPLNATVDHGSVLVSGQDVLKLPATALRRLRGREVTMVFQEPAASLNPVFTVGYQLTNAIRLHEKLSPREALGRAKTLLDRVANRSSQEAKVLARTLACAAMILWLAAPAAIRLFGSPPTLVLLALLLLALGGLLLIHEPSYSPLKRRARLCVVFAALGVMIAASLRSPSPWSRRDRNPTAVLAGPIADTFDPTHSASSANHRPTGR